MIRLSAALCATVLLLCPVITFAETPPNDHQPIMDKVVLDLAVEDWVETATARVVISIDAAVPGSDAGKIRSAMQKAVTDLVPGAEWRFSAFNRSQDQSGLENSHAELEARLKETDLGGLADKAKQASKPGLQLRVQDIDFTPTLAETEEVKAKLRNQIYGEVNDELKRLSAAEPDRKFRMSTINFTQRAAPPIVRPQMMAMRNAMPAAVDASDEDASPITVQQKVRLESRVILEAVAPKE